MVPNPLNTHLLKVNALPPRHPVSADIPADNFGPRINRSQLLVFLLGFGGLGSALVLEIINQFRYTEVTGDDLLLDILLPSLFWIAGAAFAWSLLRLPFRLQLEAGGLRRRTVFGPHFVPWTEVRAAKVSVVRGYVGLELRVGRWRWMLIPLTGYERPRLLIDAVAQRLPAGVALQLPAHFPLQDIPLKR